jgi:myo-inositol-1(or 4)-monophosphatase
MLGLLEDGVPTVGVIDLPFLGVRVDSGALADVGSLQEAIIGMGDAFHRGGARLNAYLDLTASVTGERCGSGASVL